MIEGIHKKTNKQTKNPTIVDIILSGKTLDGYPLKLGAKQSRPLQLFIDTALRVLGSEIQQYYFERKNKSVFCPENMLAYIEGLMGPTKKILELVSKISLITGYKVNRQ